MATPITTDINFLPQQYEEKILLDNTLSGNYIFLQNIIPNEFEILDTKLTNDIKNELPAFNTLSRTLKERINIIKELLIKKIDSQKITVYSTCYNSLFFNIKISEKEELHIELFLDSSNVDKEELFFNYFFDNTPTQNGIGSFENVTSYLRYIFSS